MGSGKRGHIGKVVSSQKRGITPEFAIKELRKQGIEIDEKQAENILEMMYFLDKLVVNQSFKL